MQKFPTRIPTKSLTLSDVPDRLAPWPIIGSFALTFDPAEKNPYRLEEQKLTALSVNSNLVELRAHLFLVQRRWNHFGREPDSAAMSEIQTLVGLMREKLSEQVDRSTTTGHELS